MQNMQQTACHVIELPAISIQSFLVHVMSSTSQQQYLIKYLCGFKNDTTDKQNILITHEEQSIICERNWRHIKVISAL